MSSIKADPAAIAAATERLAQALETRVPCAAVRDLIGTDDLPAAYAVQQGLVQKRLAGGVTVVGRKIGATSEAVQNQLGVDQPDFGYLLSDMDVSHGTAGTPISMRTLLQPRVEAEVAFRLSRDIDVPEEQITIDLVREAVDVALPGTGDRRLAHRGLGHQVHRHGRRQRVERPVCHRRRRPPADARSSHATSR